MLVGCLLMLVLLAAFVSVVAIWWCWRKWKIWISPRSSNLLTPEELTPPNEPLDPLFEFFSSLISAKLPFSVRLSGNVEKAELCLDHEGIHLLTRIRCSTRLFTATGEVHLNATLYTVVANRNNAPAKYLVCRLRGEMENGQVRTRIGRLAEQSTSLDNTLPEFCWLDHGLKNCGTGNWTDFRKLLTACSTPASVEERKRREQKILQHKKFNTPLHKLGFLGKPTITWLEASNNLEAIVRGNVIPWPLRTTFGRHDEPCFKTTMP